MNALKRSLQGLVLLTGIALAFQATDADAKGNKGGGHGNKMSGYNQGGNYNKGSNFGNKGGNYNKGNFGNKGSSFFPGGCYPPSHCGPYGCPPYGKHGSGWGKGNGGGWGKGNGGGWYPGNYGGDCYPGSYGCEYPSQKFPMPY